MLQKSKPTDCRFVRDVKIGVRAVQLTAVVRVRRGPV